MKVKLSQQASLALLKAMANGPGPGEATRADAVSTAEQAFNSALAQMVHEGEAELTNVTAETRDGRDVYSKSWDAVTIYGVSLSETEKQRGKPDTP